MIMLINDVINVVIKLSFDGNCHLKKCRLENDIFVNDRDSQHVKTCT